tara:strand:- start:164 stop:490 length:327 start_codon:yes stop_codon:yes gene_type:complete
VIIGAFGAHLLKNILDDYALSIYNKAVLYQIFHSLAILFNVVLYQLYPVELIKLSSLLFIIGILMFSGSLYILAITGNKTFAMITPFGGLMFIFGWFILIYVAINISM